MNGYSGDSIAFSLSFGEVLYVLGANGSGKSSLVTRLFGEHQKNAKRISAHRQTWFESNTLDLTPRRRQDFEDNFRSQDMQLEARYTAIASKMRQFKYVVARLVNTIALDLQSRFAHSRVT